MHLWLGVYDVCMVAGEAWRYKNRKWIVTKNAIMGRVFEVWMITAIDLVIFRISHIMIDYVSPENDDGWGSCYTLTLYIVWYNWGI